MSNDDLTPGKILELSGHYWKTCTLHAAVKLDIFTSIGGRAVTGGSVASELNTDPDGTERLLNALVALELLEKKEGLFSNTEAAKAFLDKASDRYVGFMILHHHYLLESWGNLDKAVSTGNPVRESTSDGDDEARREAFLMGMFNIGMQTAPLVVREFDLSGYKTFLDLGGGPGTFAIHFCMNTPGLSATVYDLPTTQPFAEKTIARFGMSDRVTFQPGNFVNQNLEGTYDVVWMSHILHGERPDTCRELIRKAAKILNPGGMLLIHEFILDTSGTAPVFPALFSLNMLLGAGGGRSYTESELETMLLAEGFSDSRRSPFVGPNSSGVISGIRKSD